MPVWEVSWLDCKGLVCYTWGMDLDEQSQRYAKGFDKLSFGHTAMLQDPVLLAAYKNLDDPSKNPKAKYYKFGRTKVLASEGAADQFIKMYRGLAADSFRAGDTQIVKMAIALLGPENKQEGFAYGYMKNKDDIPLEYKKKILDAIHGQGIHGAIVNLASAFGENKTTLTREGLDSRLALSMNDVTLDKIALAQNDTILVGRFVAGEDFSPYNYNNQEFGLQTQFKQYMALEKLAKTLGAETAKLVIVNKNNKALVELGPENVGEIAQKLQDKKKWNIEASEIARGGRKAGGKKAEEKSTKSESSEGSVGASTTRPQDSPKSKCDTCPHKKKSTAKADPFGTLKREFAWMQQLRAANRALAEQIAAGGGFNPQWAAGLGSVPTPGAG